MNITYTYTTNGIVIDITAKQAGDIVKQAMVRGFKLQSLTRRTYGYYTERQYFFIMKECGRLKSFSLFKESEDA